MCSVLCSAPVQAQEAACALLALVLSGGLEKSVAWGTRGDVAFTFWLPPFSSCGAEEADDVADDRSISRVWRLAP